MNMPSLRKRVSTYFRQLSFHHEPRQRRHNVNENAFVTQYLKGQVALKDGPPIVYGKVPADLPNYELGRYGTGYESIVGCYTGPNGGLTTIKRSERHLNVPDDIDYIDTLDESAPAPAKVPNRPGAVNNSKMVIKVAGQAYCVTNATKPKRRTQSLGSASDFEVEKTKIDREPCGANNNGAKKTAKEEPKRSQRQPVRNYALAKSKSDGNPYRVKRATKLVNDSKLPPEWNKKSDYVYGISDSLYDLNLVSKIKNGDPIADCFGVISRKDSAILAVADGVNWGEKACVAAKSAIHGCLNYLNKTIFNDTKLFENLTSVSDPLSTPTNKPLSRINDTREVFVCLLRAFNCAHDLILEKKGMLTTLTVAVVLPTTGDGFVCCVCNVGDTLAYAYSPRHGVRELTKGSHDVNANRDMRDALGALGPVDGINPELSNLTLSITTLRRGDVVFVASDGLTDNFDPNVCRFSVNRADETKTESAKEVERPKAPVKPPRKSKEKPATKNGTNDEYKEMMTNPLIAHFVQQNPVESDQGAASKPPSGLRRNHSTVEPKSQNFLRSKTAIDFQTPAKPIPRNEEGMAFVSPIQRYELQLLLMEDILKNGISGREAPCVSSRAVCENLVKFTYSITSAKRRTLEDNDLYFDSRDGVLFEVSPQEKKSRRKRGLEKVLNLPGKLDHVTVVACNIGNCATRES